MKLRPLKIEDAPLMLEWMHDPDVVKYMRIDFASKTIEDCEAFIQNSNENALHFAIVDDADQYMGTVSLKNINKESAEFGITIRSCAMGKGFSKYAIEEMLSRGFNTGLEYIYWSVNPKNLRAIRFYDKNGYKRVSIQVIMENIANTKTESLVGYSKNEIYQYLWYRKAKND